GHGDHRGSGERDHQRDGGHAGTDAAHDRRADREPIVELHAVGLTLGGERHPGIDRDQHHRHHAHEFHGFRGPERERPARGGDGLVQFRPHHRQQQRRDPHRRGHRPHRRAGERDHHWSGGDTRTDADHHRRPDGDRGRRNRRGGGGAARGGRPAPAARD